MSYQIYFLQSEEDAVQFLDQLTSLKAVFFCKGALRSPEEMKDEVISQMASCMHNYTIVPGTDADLLDTISNAQPCEIAGVEFLISSKGNPLSNTYSRGRIYYRNDENNPYNTQMIALYQKLKAFIRKNYFYSKRAMVYYTPQFKEKYDVGYYGAAERGWPIVL